MIKVGVDLDGVLYNFVESAYNYCFAYKGLDIPYEEYAKNPDEITGQNLMDYLTTLPVIYETFAARKEDVEALHSIKDICEFFYVTARPESIRLVTERFLLKSNFPHYYNLWFTKEKDAVSRLLNLDYFVDDMPKYVDQVSTTAKAYLMSTPWNQNSREEINVVFSVKEFINLIGEENG